MRAGNVGKVNFEVKYASFWGAEEIGFLLEVCQKLVPNCRNFSEASFGRTVFAVGVIHLFKENGLS